MSTAHLEIPPPGGATPSATYLDSLAKKVEPELLSRGYHKPSAPDGIREQRCRELTSLLERRRPFSVLRLGDMDLCLLLAAQEGNIIAGKWWQGTRPSGLVPYGDPGLSGKHAGRLLRSYENCSYLDTFTHLGINQTFLPQLKWNRRDNAITLTAPEETALIYEWTRHELAGVTKRNRCLFFGAEAALLNELVKDERYRGDVAPFLNLDKGHVFLQPRNNGRELDANLDAIKHDLHAAVDRQKVDIIFLSLGGAAKILCYELAEETGAAFFDFGAMLRALTFSGSSGDSSHRALHNPFLFRVPLEVYAAALQKAHPGMPLDVFFAKIHSQLCLELMRKDAGWSYPTETCDPRSMDLTRQNLDCFRESYAFYRATLRPMATSDAAAVTEVEEFKSWMAQHELGLAGKWRMVRTKAKAGLKRLARLARSRLSSSR